MAAPASVQSEEERDRRADIVVTGIAADDSDAPEKAAVAGKGPARLLDIPQSVSVVTRRQIEERNFFTIGEAVQQVTGVTVMPFDGSNPDYRARGFVLDYALTACRRPSRRAPAMAAAGARPASGGARHRAAAGARHRRRDRRRHPRCARAS